MPISTPLPRKYLSTLADAKLELREAVHRIHLVVEQFDRSMRHTQENKCHLVESESMIYRALLALESIQIAGEDQSTSHPSDEELARSFLYFLSHLLSHQAELFQCLAKGDRSRLTHWIRTEN